MIVGSRGFSRAIGAISVLIEAPVDGRPGRRRSVQAHSRAIRQPRIAARVTGKILAQQRR
ncbi:hypothetical protein GCM10010191_59370 [Actinomadura vinacea]|uniref:Uncharacterized protein n=1 Tax=Actinomadura vinacea TaxID=115336 RepID=A0ABP5WV14_9ACTN